VIPFVENRIKLVTDLIDELDTATAGTARVDDEVLRGILGAHTNQWDGEDFVLFFQIARVGGCKVIHGHGEVAALQGMTGDLPARLPGHAFTLILNSGCLVARNGPQLDLDMWCESIQEE
jgi:hypothetical protein